MDSDKSFNELNITKEDVRKNVYKRKPLHSDEERKKNQNYSEIDIKVKPKINYITQQKTNVKNDKLLNDSINDDHLKNLHKRLKQNFIYNTLFIIIIIIIIFTIIIIIIYILSPHHISFLQNNTTNEDLLKDVKTNLKSLRSKYRNQEEDLWLDVFASIKMMIENPTKPNIILLLANKWEPLDCLVILLANASSKALNTNTLLLTPENFESNTGSVITSMVSKVENNKTVIIWDLLNINIEALKAFHNLCDTINPLIKEVIYLITIIADNYDNKINPLEFIENEIMKKLNGKVRDDIILPLITRITDGTILKIKSEPTITDCPLHKITKKAYNL